MVKQISRYHSKRVQQQYAHSICLAGMEFFERAHVVKSKHSSDDKMKKQFKQMLYGYKQQDNKRIKDAANVEKEQEDSTSVSGYSDLNLTVSSTESTSTRQRISLIDPNRTINDSFGNESHKSEPLNSILDADVNMSESSDASLSDLKDDIQSLSADTSLDIEEGRGSDESDDHFSMTSTSLDPSSDIESSESEPFDHDGKLASKILEKLKLNDKSNKKVSEKRKRKLEKEDEPYHSSEGFSQIESDCSSSVLQSEPEVDRESETSMSHSNVLSPSFVSVNASDMPNQDLSEVLGDYKHPTIRNLPCESLNVFANNQSGIFATTDLDDSEIDKEFNSLLPEMGSELSIVDLDDSTDMPVDESTSCYDDTVQSNQTYQRETSTDSIDTKFVSPTQVYYGKSCVIIVLKHPTEIYIQGKVRVTRLGGIVEIGGYILQDNKYNVYAPNHNCAQYLRTVEHGNGFYGLFGKLTGSGISVAAAEEIVTTLGNHDSVVQLQPLRDRVAQFVENNCTADLFTKISKNVDSCFQKASELLGCSLYLMKPWKCFEENLCWNQVLKYGYKNQSRGIICGGKGSGKSSFLRYYVNKLLAAGPVLVIDLDPGQCEFTVAGNVSATVVTEPLLGPSFTHLKKPERMLNIGIINTMDNTRRYANAVKEIIAYCYSEERLRALPWIVNTMGMCNALGQQFMTLITLLVQPTFMLQMDSKNPRKRFEHYLDPSTVLRLYNQYQRSYLFSSISPPDVLDYAFVVSSTDSAIKNNFSMTPKDERYLNFLAYFGSMLDTYTCPTDCLLDVVPYEVDLRNLYIAVNVRINRESITRVINGKIVALCKHRGNNAAKMFTLADKPLQCYGYGLIRGIDAEKGCVYVATVEAPGTADTLLYADWAPEPPGAARLPAGTPVPYRAPYEAHLRQLMTAPRRRYNPIQLLKTSRIPKVKASS